MRRTRFSFPARSFHAIRILRPVRAIRAIRAAGLLAVAALAPAASVAPVTASADIVNGSFETPEGTPSLAGWHVSGGASAPGGPPGGGSWCLSLAKNLLAATAWQDAGASVEARSWRLTAWVRNDTASQGAVIARWCVRRSFDPEVLEPLGEKQITLTEWTQVTVDVTPDDLEQGDTLAVCLLVVSQEANQHAGFVDLVSAGPLVPVEGATWGRIKALYGESRRAGKPGAGEERKRGGSGP
jgi:hypothetical protein